MRPYLYHLVMGYFGVFSIMGCLQNAAPVDENARPMAYSETQLESFLDSVGRLPIESMVKEARHYSDSVFYGIQPLAINWREEDFSRLLVEAKKGGVSESLAQKYHLNYQKEMLHEGKIPAESFIFNIQRGEFALSFGPEASWGADVYFFQRNRCIGKQYINHKYGLELDYYTDAERKTVIFYKEIHISGTGIWWVDYYFYRYEEGILTPILNELEDGNLSQMPTSRRLESTIVATNPLTLKMVYRLSGETEEYIFNDSTLVKYHWDAKNKILRGNYKQSKLDRAQVLSFNLGVESDLFFMRAHYSAIRELLKGKDKAKRKLVMYFLNDAKTDLDD